MKSDKTLTEIVEQALTNIDSKKLINTFNLSKYGDKVLERTWQFEMYKALEKCLPGNINMSVEVGGLFTDEGIVDLYVHEYEWAIELLLDGKGMQEHHNRFQDGNILTISNLLIILINYPFNK